MRKALLLAAGLGLLLADGATAAPLGAARQPIASDAAQGVQLVRHRTYRRHVVRRGYYVSRRAGYAGGYVAAPAPYYAAPVAPGPGPIYYGNRGDPLGRYYTPGLAHNVGNPSVSPSYQNPAVDSGLLYPKE